MGTQGMFFRIVSSLSYAETGPNQTISVTVSAGMKLKGLRYDIVCLLQATRFCSVRQPLDLRNSIDLAS